MPDTCAPFDVPYFDQELGLGGRDPSLDSYSAHDETFEGAANLTCNWPSPGGLYFQVNVINMQSLLADPLSCPADGEQGESVTLGAGVTALYCHTEAPYLLWKQNGVRVLLVRGVVSPHQPDDYKSALIDFGTYLTSVL